MDTPAHERLDSEPRPSEVLAASAFEDLGAPQGGADPPVTIVLSGEPLSGKTTLARRLMERAVEPALHVENDALRPRVARILGSATPTYSGRESGLTYHTAWALQDLALGRGVHALMDATNLLDKGRRGAYRVADKHGSPVLVVRVEAPEPLVRHRVATAPPWRVRAWTALQGRAEPIRKASRPWVAVEVGAHEGAAGDFATVDAAVDALRGLPWFHWVDGPGLSRGGPSSILKGTAPNP